MLEKRQKLPLFEQKMYKFLIDKWTVFLIFVFKVPDVALESLAFCIGKFDIFDKMYCLV